jgi:toxin FitB
VSYLLDTNVLSEMRKQERANPHVLAFAERAGKANSHTSWIVVAEMRRGVGLVRRHDPLQANVLDAWIAEVLESLGDRVHPVDKRVAEKWAEIMVPNPRSPLDAFVAATALVHGLIIVTRNIRHFEGTGVQLLNPWAFDS